MPKSVFYKISHDRKNKLIKPAVKEFVSKPYNKITVSSLTDTMRILRTDFYYYFSDKDDIYDAILEDFYNSIIKEKSDATFQDALKIFFEKVVEIDSSRLKQYVIDITENYHPQFAVELSKRMRKLFKCNCDGDKPQVKVMTKIYRFMTVVNLYLKGCWSVQSAREILDTKD